MARGSRTTMSSLLLAWLVATLLLPTFRDAAAADGTWKRLGPPPRTWGPTAVFDPLRNRMVAFGGSPLGESISNSYDVAWSLSLTGTPTWTGLTNRGTGPLGRESTSAIYDPVRDRMIVFGGIGSSTFGDTWALSLSGTPAWTQIITAGPAPVPRGGHTAIYDPIRDRMIVFGGTDASHVDHNDVWALSLSGTPVWTQLTPTGTPLASRAWHTAIYDPVRDRMVVFGGYVWGVSSLGDTWSLSLFGTPAWSPLAASGSASARNSHSAIYDPVGDRMVVYGGYDDPDNPLQLAVLSFAGSPAWSQVTPAGTAPPTIRDGAAAVYDEPNHRIVYYAGIDPEFANVWSVNLSGTPTWSAIGPVGTSARRQGPVVYDSLRDRMVLLAGENGNIALYALSLVGEPAWSGTVPGGAAPPVGILFSAIYDPPRDRAVIFVSTDPPELWALDFATSVWSNLMPAGTPPSTRAGTTAIYDPVRDRMLVHGGQSGLSFFDEVWAINLSAPLAWSQLVMFGGTPVARENHMAIYDSSRDDMVIFGGHDGPFSYRRDAWKLDLGTNTWTEIVPTAPLASDHQAMAGVYDAPRDRLLFFGGSNPSDLTNELWELSLAGTPTWTQLVPSGLVPLPRTKHRAFHDPVRDRMVIYGGHDVVGNLDETWAFSPGATVGVPGLPGPRNSGLALARPRPNPSRGIATVEYTLPRPGHVTLDVFDTRGRRVRALESGLLPEGSHSATWNGEDERGLPAASGLYFVRLRCDGQELTQRLVRVF